MGVKCPFINAVLKICATVQDWKRRGIHFTAILCRCLPYSLNTSHHKLSTVIFSSNVVSFILYQCLLAPNNAHLAPDTN